MNNIQGGVPMKRSVFMKAVSAAVSIQMICAALPQLTGVASAASDYYLNEDCSTFTGNWKLKNNAEVKTDEAAPYIRYKSDAISGNYYTRCDLATKITSTDAIYIAEADVRFEDGNSGVLEFRAGSNLGPTVMFDGTNIKAKTGGTAYVTMYSNAEAGKWYNMKLVANGTSSVYGYTKDIAAGTAAQATASDIKRNLEKGTLTQIHITSLENGVNNVTRSGAVDVRDLKVYKPLPDTLEIGADAEEIAIPQTAAANTMQFNVKNAKTDGIDLTGYDLTGQGIVSYKLYNADDTAEVSPSGISLNASTGLLSVTSAASAGIYSVRLVNYDGSAYASKRISVANMGEADAIEFAEAPDLIPIPASGSASAKYSVKVTDTNGNVTSGAAADWALLDGSGNIITDDKLTISDGVVTAFAGANYSSVTVRASIGSVSASKEITLYNQTLEKIVIDGDRSIEIPKSGTKSFAYSAKALDQKGCEISGAELTWSMAADDNTDISFSPSTVTAGANAKEQLLTLTASSGNVTGEMRVTVTENLFRYKPVDGGYEIDTTSPSSAKNYTRPIYAPHINDKGETSNRYLYYLGDRPKLVLSNESTASSFRRFMNLFLGIKGGKWIDQMQNTTARYVDGHEEYEVTDPSFEGKIRLTYTRSDRIDGMMIRVELPDDLKDKLVVAAAGQGGVAAAQPVGGNSTKLEFNYEDTKSNTIDVSDNIFTIGNNGTVEFADGKSSIDGTASVEMNFSVKDASKYSAGVDSLLASTDTTYPMAVGTTEGNSENTIYIITAPQSSKNEDIANYKTNAEEYFKDGISYYKRVSETIKIDTPDPYINSGVKAQVMAMDNIWDDPVITHGAIGWHNGQGGWRGGYCFVDAGWADRIKTNIRHYINHQNEDGRIWAYPSQDGRYNMSLVMVDIIMQYWDWTGDNAFFADEGGYDFIAKHLEFMDKEMQVPGTNLYENWLDAWNTDNKWNNGGAGSIATSYTWRAYNTMAKIAAQLGKPDDAAKYQAKADAIKKEMNEQLWDTDTGVFGELRERFGHGRLNAAPDLSSVYTVVDMGLATKEQVYQMMRFTDYAVPSIAGQNDIWHDIDFKYSSNRPPEHYSSDGLYIEEVMNNALAYFENGQREMGMKQFRACLVPLMKGSSAGQGTVQHIVRDTLDNNGHIDFADCTSQYARTALEGIFGIKMHVPEGRVDITPGFPQDWTHASVETSYLKYDYKYENNTDTFNVSTEKSLRYAMHIPARSSKIESVTVNGAAAEFTVDNFVNVTTPAGYSAQIKVTYANDEIAKIESSEIGGAGAEHTVRSNGTITAVSDPQGITTAVSGTGGNTITVTLGEKTGNHTFFVTVEKNDMKAVLPVDLEIKGGIEITDAQITNEGISVKLTNNTEDQVSVNAELSTVSGSVTRDVTIAAKGKSEAMLVPVENASDLTPGNNKVTAVLSGDVNETITGEATDWDLKDKVTNSSEQFTTISLDGVVNQDLRTVHENTYDITYDGDEHYRIPNFYWSKDASRTVLPNGRSWWESSSPSHTGANGVPASLSLPDGGTFTSDTGVPFEIASNGGRNAAFVSLYNQFPDKLNVPVNTDGSKIYFMLSVSTNNMQSRIENARITVNLDGGETEVLPLTNPDNIDDWLNYQTAKPYAESGYAQMLGEKAHSNILAVDLGEARHIESVDFECLASEVLAGLLGVTVVNGEVSKPQIREAQFYDTRDDQAGFTAVFTTKNTVSELTWYLKKTEGEYIEVPETGNLPQITGGTVKVGLIVGGLNDELKAEDISAGYTVK